MRLYFDSNFTSVNLNCPIGIVSFLPIMKCLPIMAWLTGVQRGHSAQVCPRFALCCDLLWFSEHFTLVCKDFFTTGAFGVGRSWFPRASEENTLRNTGVNWIIRRQCSHNKTKPRNSHFVACYSLKPLPIDLNFADISGTLLDTGRTTIQISLTSVPKYLIDIKSAFSEAITWCLSGDQPLHESMMIHFTVTYKHHRASVCWERTGNP